MEDNETNILLGNTCKVLCPLPGKVGTGEWLTSVILPNSFQKCFVKLYTHQLRIRVLCSSHSHQSVFSLFKSLLIKQLEVTSCFDFFKRLRLCLNAGLPHTHFTGYMHFLARELSTRILWQYSVLPLFT